MYKVWCLEKFVVIDNAQRIIPKSFKRLGEPQIWFGAIRIVCVAPKVSEISRLASITSLHVPNPDLMYHSNILERKIALFQHKGVWIPKLPKSYSFCIYICIQNIMSKENFQFRQ